MDARAYRIAWEGLIARSISPHTLACPGDIEARLAALAPLAPRTLYRDAFDEALYARGVAEKTAAPVAALAATLRTVALLSAEPRRAWAQQPIPRAVPDWGAPDLDPEDATVFWGITRSRPPDATLRRLGSIELARAARARLRGRLVLTPPAHCPAPSFASRATPRDKLASDLLALLSWRDGDAAALPAAENQSLLSALCASVCSDRGDGLDRAWEYLDEARPDVCLLAAALAAARTGLPADTLERHFASAAIAPDACERRLELLFEFQSRRPETIVPILLHVAPEFAVLTSPWAGVGPISRVEDAVSVWRSACSSSHGGRARAVADALGRFLSADQ